MAEIIKTFRESVPAMRFIGKIYPDFGGWWGDWFENGWFDQIEKAMGGAETILKIWENGGGYVGLERHCGDQLATHWIGMFTPADTSVPEGFDYIDFPAAALGTCWIYGRGAEIHDSSACRPAVEHSGMTLRKDENGAIWSFENCIRSRFTTPDEQGNIILDYCYYVECPPFQNCIAVGD